VAWVTGQAVPDPGGVWSGLSGMHPDTGQDRADSSFVSSGHIAICSTWARMRSLCGARPAT